MSHRRIPVVKRGAHLTPGLLATLDELIDRWPDASAGQLVLAFADKTGRVIGKSLALKRKQTRKRDRELDQVAGTDQVPSRDETEKIFGDQVGFPTDR